VPTRESMLNTYSYPKPSPFPPSGLNNVVLQLVPPGRGGFAMGYGGGLRTSLFGYFMRVDAAWNTDGDKKPMIYLALGTDF